MDDFNPDDFLAEAEAGQQPPATDGFDPDSFLEGQTDPSTGELRPTYANGLTPETPLTKSPVDITDRMSLALGNKGGGLKFLKSKFEDAAVDKHGKFLVKNQGMWHQVDPKNLGDGDPWERSKELIGDLAEAIPSTIKGAAMGAAAGAPVAGVGAIPGAILGAGTSLVAEAFSDDISAFIENNAGAIGGAAAVLGYQGLKKVGAKSIAKANWPMVAAGAVAEAGRTSLGRLVGTYEGSAEDQVKDIAFESILNMGGATIGAGVKPTAQVIGDSIKKTAEIFRKAPAITKDLVANSFGLTSGAGHANTMTLLEEGPAVGNTIKRLGAGAVNTDQMVERATSESIDTVKKIARRVPEARSKIWNQMTNDILESVDDSFSSNADDLVRAAQMKAVDSKIGNFVRTTADMSDIDAKIAGKAVMKNSVVPKEELTKLMAENKGKLPSDLKFQLKTHEEIVNQARKTGEIPEEFLDPDSFKFITEFYHGLKPFEGMKQANGKEGARQLLSMKRYLGNMTYKITESAKDEALPATAIAIKDIEGVLDGRLASKFDTPNGNVFLERNEFWKKSSNELSNVLKTIERARKSQSNEPYEQLFKQITSRPAQNQVKKEGFEAAIEVAKQAGLDLSSDVKQLKVLQSARAFTPRVRPGVGTNVLYAAFGAAVSGNIPLAMGTAAVGLSLSPAVNRVAIGAGQAVANQAAAASSVPAKAAAPLIAAGFKGMGFLRQLPPEQLKLMVNSPQVVASFIDSIASVPRIQQEGADLLVNATLQKTRPTPTQFPQSEE